MSTSADGRATLDSSGLARLALASRELAESTSLDETLQRVVDLTRRTVESCTDASIAFRGRDGLSTPAATSSRALRLDQVQLELGEGPCLSAVIDQRTHAVGDLRSSDRWPAWAARAVDDGILSMMGVVLFVRDDTLGALNVYADEPHAFGDEDRAVIEVLAAIASLAMKSAINEAGLERAVASRDVIGQAKGIIMERDRVTGQEAFERLRRLSSDTGRKLNDVARELTETGDLTS